MKKVKLIFVGGFLGAGKSTLLWKAGKELIKLGKRVALITNDQAPNLVDTNLLQRHGLQVAEVAGSCFCCNFNGLISAAEKLQDVDVLLAEPVGSCTDLSATILQPLKDLYKDNISCAPLSVLADPNLLEGILKGQNSELHPSAAYIVKKQLQEADWIVINKTDLLHAEQLDKLREMLTRKFPDCRVKAISAKTSEGINEWLNDALSETKAGCKIVDVDYDVYAEGEAVLGWLNAEVKLTAKSETAVTAEDFCRNLMENLKEKFRKLNACIGHVKILLATSDGELVCNLTSNNQPVSYRGNLPSSIKQASLIINARVEIIPDKLEVIVRRSLEQVSDLLHFEIKKLTCLSPGRPNPTHRYNKVIN